MKRIVFLVMWMTACGTGADLNPQEKGTPRDAGLVDAIASPTPSCNANGVRICGGECGDAGCSVCTALVGSNDGYGVCWEDLADFGDTSCAMCTVGEGCVERTPNRFVCVPLSVCDAMISWGETGACWYSDKTPYTGEGTAVAPCSDAGDLCGVGCNCDPSNAVECSIGGAYLPACIGTSATAPVGFFAEIPESFGLDTMQAYPTCSIAYGDAGAVPCPSDTKDGVYLSCAVFSGPIADPRVAAETGICLLTSQCATLKGQIDVSCY